MSEQFKSTIDNREESPVLSYLTEKNKTLIHDYKTPDGNYAESCGLIAVDIARLLLKEGKRPSIVFVRGQQRKDTGIVANESLVPIQYQGRVSWGGHTVCVCEGMVYDPMLGNPCPIETYAHEAFGTDIEMETSITEDQIEDFVKE